MVDESPLIRLGKIIKSKIKVGNKVYTQGLITIPKNYLKKLENEKVDKFVITVDNMMICIPNKMLKQRSKASFINEFIKLIDWLKLHYKEPEE